MTVMMPRASCPSCCQHCRDLAPSNNDSPFALENLIPVGVVNINVLDGDGATAATLCVHSHAEDGWHAFNGSALLTHLTSMVDDSFCRELDFLIKHHFVSATYRFDDNQSIIVRIYLIPYDLPNVQGRLRVRKEAISSLARRYLSALLPRIRFCFQDWNGHCCQSCSPLLDIAEDDRTLAEIYSELPSPKPSIAPRWEEISSRLLDFDDDLKGLGMRSILFQYQCQSVAALLQKEMDVSAIEDPLYVCRVDLKGNRFYLQPAKMEILRERPMVSPARGGILCEELGTGKTVMILTLIVATIREISSPEESLQDDMPVMTPLALRHFPSVFETARQRLLSGKQQTMIQSGEFPSLRELLLHHHRTSPYSYVPDLSTAQGVSRHRKRQHLHDKFECTGLAEVQKANIPFYFHYRNNDDNCANPRKTTINGPRIMYLTNATLVVIPANLVSQWDREIIKHCEYPVRVLILRTGTSTPTARSLASDYDIILTTYSRFTAEANCKDISKLHPWKMCKCPPFKEARVPDCRCKSPDVSPFFQVRWKRLVIDEGHVSSSRFSTLIQLVRLLSVERRWIITGTPTTNLLGLSFGNKAVAEDDEPTGQEDGDSSYLTSLRRVFIEPPPMQNGTSLSPGSTTRSGSEAQTPPRNSSARIWNKYDRDDLYKLGNMITHFLAVPQFSAEVKLMYNQVTAPLLDPRGPRPGSIQVLTQVMQMVMVRHRTRDIENDVVLPPLTHNSVLLDLEPLAIKSYNAMQAAIAINAIDSERTGQDYFFHPSNADALQLAVKNMSQLMLWSVDDQNLYSVDQLLLDKDKHIQRAIERNIPGEDMRLLYDAFRHIRLAAEDPLWRALQSHEDVPYHVSHMNLRVFEAWTRACQKDPMTPMMNGFMHVDRILRLHDFVVRQPLATEEVIVEKGQQISEEDLELRRRFIEAQEKKGKGNKKALQDEHVSLAGNATKKAAASDTLKEMQNELSASIARLDYGENVLPAAATPRHSGSSSYSELFSSSPHARIRIGHSVSSKINWIINEVKSHSTTEKFLIFSDSELSLAHVAEALELIQVRFLRFTTQIEPRLREQLVLTFETSETYRVFLMELKHGARGLNLISASRVIFCEPVWQADAESQAIKRAHRIGQMKKITVTTLAIRGTAEERMVARKELFKGSRDKIPKLIEEAGMRHFIANPKFVENRSELLTSVDEPLFKIKTVTEARPTTDNSPRPAKRLRFEVPGSNPVKEHRIRVEDRIGPKQRGLHKKKTPHVDIS